MEHNEKWEIVLENGKANRPYGIRTENGFICFMIDIFHYAGQEKRFQEELSENMANARLIAAAPDLLKAIENVTQDGGTMEYLEMHNPSLRVKLEQALEQSKNRS